MTTPFLVVLSSPSGGGKTTVANALVTARDDLRYSVSATTRRPRKPEQDGVDYVFLTREEFQQRQHAGEFLESAEYSGNLYGTLESEVNRILSTGCNVLLDIEVQGLQQIRQRRDDVVSIFILPPSADTLIQRLRDRGPPAPKQLRARLRRATQELQEAPEYDYIVVNHDRSQVVAEVAAIIDSESRRASRIADLAEELTQMRRDLTAMVEGLERQQ